MSLSERIALLQAPKDIPESDRQIACGELLLLLLVALRQATSEDGIIALPGEARKFIEQKAIEGVADVLTQCFGLKTLYPGILDVEFDHLKQGLRKMENNLLFLCSLEDLSHLVPWLFSGKSSHGSIGKSCDGRMEDIERRMHDSRGDIQDCEEPTDEELLERMRESSASFAERIQQTFQKMEQDTGLRPRDSD